MKSIKRSSLVTLSTVALLAMAAGGTSGVSLLSPITASAAAVNDNLANGTDAFSSGYSFLDKGNPSSMRERIEAKYSPVFVELYDLMQKELREQTVNNKNTLDQFTVKIDLKDYRYQVSEGNDKSNDISFQLLRFAQNVLEDSPYFYWTNSENKVKMTYYYYDKYYTSVEFGFLIDSSFRTYEQRKKANDDIESVIEGYREAVKDKKDTVSKLKAVNDKLVLDTYYDISSDGTGLSPNSQNAYGCLINHFCVCNGYAKAFQLICNTLGITDTIRVSGSLKNNSSNTYVSHAWNGCKVGGKWYFVDVTANDPLKDTQGRNEHNDPEKYRRYFLIGSDKLKEDHQIETRAVPYPVFEENDYEDIEFGTVEIGGNEYFVISDETELWAFAELAGQYTVSPNAILTADIDLHGMLFEPMCREGCFNGIFDGSGHTIKGLNVTASDSPAGLFAYTDKAVIKNLTLGSGTVSGSLTDSNTGSGAFAGNITSDTVIENCVNNGVNVSGMNAGGIAGIVYGDITSDKAGVISKCTFAAKVSAQKYGGGIAGSNESVDGVLIEESSSLGTVDAETAGSFIGRSAGSASVNNSISTIPYDVYGETGNAAVYTSNVFLTAYDSDMEGTVYDKDPEDGSIAYALGWGQIIGSDILPSPSLTSAAGKVHLFEYVKGETVGRKYFNGGFNAEFFPDEELPEGFAWVYDDKEAVLEELAGLTKDIKITAEKMNAYLSDLAYMTIGESMSYICLVGADDEIANIAESSNLSPVIFSAVTESGIPVKFSLAGVKEIGGRKYIEYSIDIPAKNLSDDISCEVTFERNGKQFTLNARKRSASDYLTQLAADTEQPEKVRKAAAAILNYAAAVQTYKGYNTDRLSNQLLAPEQRVTAEVKKEDIEVGAPVFTEGDSRISLKAVTVDMLSKTSLRAYYKLSGEALTAYENDSLRFDYTSPDGKEVSVMVGEGAEVSGICGRQGDYIWVELPEGISPADYGKYAEISLGTDTFTGDSIRYSVLDYIAEKCETQNGMAEVVAALYRYYEAVTEL